MPIQPSDAAKVAAVKNLTQGVKDAWGPDILAGIWDRAFQGSVVQQVAGTIPLELNGAALPYPVGQPTASVVSEMGEKPLVKAGIDVKMIKPIKVAAILVYSMEMAQANPLRAFDSIRATLSNAISRAIDNAVIHGKDAPSGAVIPDVEALTSTTKEVEIDKASTKPGYLHDAILDGYDLVNVSDGAGGRFGMTHLLASQAMRSLFLRGKDTTGRPLYQGSHDITVQVANIMGLPTHFSDAVNGYEATSQPNLLAIGGAFNQNLQLGFVNRLQTSVASEYAGGMDLFTHNMHAIRVEAQFGWGIRSKDAFVKYVAKA